MKNIFEMSDKETTNIIWKHLYTISALVNPSRKGKKLLEKLTSDGSRAEWGSANKDNNFLADIFKKVEKEIGDKDIQNPMEAIGTIMKSGVFTDIVTTLGNGIEDGSLDMASMVQNLGGMCGKLSSDNSNSGGIPDMLKMVQPMLSGLANSSSSNSEDLPDMLKMVQPMLSGLVNSSSSNSEDLTDLLKIVQPKPQSDDDGATSGSQIRAELERVKPNSN